MQNEQNRRVPDKASLPPKTVAPPPPPARFRQVIQPLFKPRNAEGVDCLPPTRPAVATASPDDPDGAFLRFVADHPDAVLRLSMPEGQRCLVVDAQHGGRGMQMRVSTIQLDLDRRDGFPTIREVLRTIERQLFTPAKE